MCDGRGVRLLACFVTALSCHSGAFFLAFFFSNFLLFKLRRLVLNHNTLLHVHTKEKLSGRDTAATCKTQVTHTNSSNLVILILHCAFDAAAAFPTLSRSLIVSYVTRYHSFQLSLVYNRGCQTVRRTYPGRPWESCRGVCGGGGHVR